VKDQGYEDWSSMVLRRYLNTIQSEYNSFEIPRHHMTKERLKMVENSRIRAPSHAPCAWTRAGSVVCLFFKPFFCEENPIFTLLIPM